MYAPVTDEKIAEGKESLIIVDPKGIYSSAHTNLRLKTDIPSGR